MQVEAIHTRSPPADGRFRPKRSQCAHSLDPCARPPTSRKTLAHGGRPDVVEGGRGVRGRQVHVTLPWVAPEAPAFEKANDAPVDRRKHGRHFLVARCGGRDEAKRAVVFDEDPVHHEGMEVHV